MKLSKTGIRLITQFEGCQLEAYTDPVGVLTIGYGHTKGVYKGKVITKMDAIKYLHEDLLKFENHVNMYNDIYHWTQPEFDALVSFAFNIGSITQLTANGTRSKSEIAASMLLYNKAGGKVLEGLTRRRKAERDLFLSNTNETTKKEGGYNMPIIKYGSQGRAVKIWQIIIGARCDGVFGLETSQLTTKFQKSHNLDIDGVVGSNTWTVGLNSIGA